MPKKKQAPTGPNRRLCWQARATASAVAAARNVITGGSVNGRAMVSSLSEIELGWIACAAIFGWIETKAQQAVEEGRSANDTIVEMHRDPGPWEAGAIAATLPQLAAVELDWAKPLNDWRKDEITKFVWSAYRLCNAALAARDEGAADKIVRYRRDTTEREHSAANGGPLMTHDELQEEGPPF